MKRILIYVLLSLLSLSVVSQDITVKAQYSPVVSAGEQFVISWIVNAGGGEFIAPPFNGFYKLIGPQTSFSSSTQIVNGKFTQQTTNTFLYYLQAKEKGRYVLAPAIYRVKNKEYKSDSIYVEVVEGDVTVKPAGRQNDQNAAGEISDQMPSSNLFIRLILNRGEVYQGEHIVATVKLYSRVDLGGITEVKFPDFKGFLREDIETPQLRTLQSEYVNGTEYGTGVIQQFLLYPQVTGEINIDPVEITALVQQKTGNPDPFFGDFFAQVSNVPKVVASKPVKVVVNALPGNRPADFSGIVGKIELGASLSRDTVNVNDALNLKITINGSGNLKIAGAPDLKLSPDIEVFEPKITDNIRNNAGGTSGQKVFEYVLIPRHYGSFTVPSVTYSYFNSSTKRYEKLTTKEFSFYARKGEDQASGAAVYSGVSKEDVKYIGRDIRFIKSGTGNMTVSRTALTSSRTFLSLYGFALFFFFAVLFLRREQIKRNSDISKVRNRRAASVARKRLAEASKCLKAGMKDRFHEEILKSIWGYLSHKLNIPVADLTRVAAVEALVSKGIEADTIKSLEAILDKCEYARFAPSTSDTEVAEIFESATRFISTVEKTT